MVDVAEAQLAGAAGLRSRGLQADGVARGVDPGRQSARLRAPGGRPRPRSPRTRGSSDEPHRGRPSSRG
jgi:hypothetical protein